MAHALRDICLGIIELAHPDAKPTVNEDYREALKRTGVKDRSDRLQEELKKSRQWAYLFKVVHFSINLNIHLVDLMLVW